MKKIMLPILFTCCLAISSAAFADCYFGYTIDFREGNPPVSISDDAKVTTQVIDSNNQPVSYTYDEHLTYGQYKAGQGWFSTSAQPLPDTKLSPDKQYNVSLIFTQNGNESRYVSEPLRCKSDTSNHILMFPANFKK